MTKFEIISSRDMHATPRIIGSQQPRTKETSWFALNALPLTIGVLVAAGLALGLGLGLGLGLRSDNTQSSTITSVPLTAVASNWTGFSASPFTGGVIFSQAPRSSVVTVTLSFSGLPANSAHGVHIHAMSDLSQGCGTAGHFNPGNLSHGYPANPVRHVGDFGGNVITDALGTAAATLTDTVISLTPSSSNYVVGLAVVVHAQADDGTQPSGAAGARLGCALIAAPAVAVANGWTGGAGGSAPFAGAVTFSQAAGSPFVTIAVALTGLPPGYHGMHVHAITDISTGCGTAGHLNPLGQPHGFPSSTTGRHVGDGGNIFADADGSVMATFTDGVMSLQPGAVGNVVGYAIVVHSAADDGTSQPSGNAGTRLGCSLIVRQ